MFICYKVTNTVNGKLYIGQTSASLETRWKRHVGDATWNALPANKKVFALHRAIQKYGAGSFIMEILETALTSEEIYAAERKYIKLLNTHTSHHQGYNMTHGGPGIVGRIITDATRLKLSIAHKGKKRGPRSDIVKKKISETKRLLGHGPSKLCNQRRSDTGRGVPRSQEVKDRIQTTLKGKPRPPEVIKKIRAGWARRNSHA